MPNVSDSRVENNQTASLKTRVPNNLWAQVGNERWEGYLDSQEKIGLEAAHNL